MPVDPTIPPGGGRDERIAEALARLERKVAALERLQVQTITFTDGTRLRVETGKTASGRWGIRVYDNTGALIHDYTTAA
jgi:hypothetical protein